MKYSTSLVILAYIASQVSSAPVATIFASEKRAEADVENVDSPLYYFGGYNKRDAAPAPVLIENREDEEGAAVDSPLYYFGGYKKRDAVPAVKGEESDVDSPLYYFGGYKKRDAAPAPVLVGKREDEEGAEVDAPLYYFGGYKKREEKK